MAQNESRHFADRIIASDKNHRAVARNLRDDADGTVLVGQICQLTNEKPQVRLVTNVALLSAEWVLQFSIENESEGERTKEEATEIGMKVTSGQEVSESIKASAGFSGWGFSAEVSGSTETKTFTTFETTSVTKVTDTYTCPPHSSIFVYKRRYKFLCTNWFYDEEHDAWIESPSGVKFQAQFVNEITANRELISAVELTNRGRITNNPPSGLFLPTKGFRIGSSIVWITWYILLKTTYPWVQ